MPTDPVPFPRTDVVVRPPRFCAQCGAAELTVSPFASGTGDLAWDVTCDECLWVGVVYTPDA